LPVLSESQSVELAKLDVLYEAGKLAEPERTRWRLLKTGNRPTTTGTLGTRAVLSPGFKGLAVKAQRTTSPSAALVHEDVPLANVEDGAEVKALITGLSDTSAGAHITQEPAEYAPQPRRRLRILDLVNTAETTVDAIEYARQTTFTNVAVETAEATSTTTGTKPEATIAFEKRTEAVRNFPVWVPATRRALSDVTGMRETVDGQLTYAARRALEEAVVAAMVADAGATQAKGADATPVAVLKLLTALRNADVEPTAALLNPADYEQIRTLSGTSPYLAGPPITVDDSGVERLFAIPLIVTPSVPDDTAVIADMQSVGVWLRSLQVYVSQSHASYFVHNLAAILCELRAALAVTAPAGVGKVTGWD
jgi:Phage capsid family